MAASQGVVYAAAGNKYAEEAEKSARRLKEVSDLPVTLFTDEDVSDTVFDEVRQLKNPRYGLIDKILPMTESPYDRTLYLDTDTYVYSDISEMFELLDRYDVMGAPNPVRHHKPVEEIPEAFPEFNTGVILYRSTEEVRSVFQKWRKLHEENLEEHGQMVDETALRQALYESDLCVGFLTDEYNCRFFGPTFLEGEAKIIHGRHPDIEAMAEAINEETGKRVLTGNSDRRIIAEPKPMRTIKYPGPGKYRAYGAALRRSLAENGLGGTVKLSWERFRRRF